MKRKQFLIVSAVVSMMFGIPMILAPNLVLANLLLPGVANASTAMVMQILGSSLLATAFVNLLSRNDEGSVALRAIMIGNIIWHVVGWGVDFHGYFSNIMNPVGLISGSVVHAGLIIGFAYYLSKLPRPAKA